VILAGTRENFYEGIKRYMKSLTDKTKTKFQGSVLLTIEFAYDNLA
jgi:hypothetical protein